MMKKSFLSAMTVLCIALCICSITSFAVAVGNGECGENVTWTLNEEGVLSIEGSGSMTDYPNYSSIPWYSLRNSIKSVTVSEGITSIGNRAFYNCSSIADISLPQTLSEIGDYAFNGCESLEEVSLPVSLDEIGNRAFYKCQSLTEITIPNGVTVLKSSTFAKCSLLSDVTLGKGLTELEDSVFEECETLSTIVLGENIEFFGEDIFTDCSEELVLVAYCDTPSAEYCMSQQYNYVIKCKVAFYCDSVLLYENEFDLSSTFTLPENTIAKEGYDFLGWDTGKEILSAGETITLNTAIIANALWEMQTFTVMFETGTANNPRPLTKKYWEKLLLDVETPVREGCNFLGWSTVENADVAQYGEKSEFDVNSDTVLYGVWEEKTYTVTYEIPEAENSIEPQTKKHTQTLQLSDVLPVREGYTFIGWARKNEAIIAEFLPGELFTVNEETVLYAVWTSGIISGDVDNNGKVDISDLLLLVKYTSNSTASFNQNNIAAMDTYKDSYINMKDVLKLAQYLAGWSNVVLGK